MGHQSSISPLISAFRRYLRTQRDARRARAELEADLSHYCTLGDRRELGAIMDRHTPEETEELRAILGQQQIIA